MAEQVLHKEDVTKLMGLIHKFSNRWRDIGMELGFTPLELDQIGTIPVSSTTSSRRYMTEVLSQWVQWPTEDHPTKPTLGVLCDALCSSLVGLGKLAVTVKREVKSSSSASKTKPILLLMGIAYYYGK